MGSRSAESGAGLCVSGTVPARPVVHWDPRRISGGRIDLAWEFTGGKCLVDLVVGNSSDCVCLGRPWRGPPTWKDADVLRKHHGAARVAHAMLDRSEDRGVRARNPSNSRHYHSCPVSRWLSELH